MREMEILIHCGLSRRYESYCVLFISKSSCLLGRLWSLGGEQEYMGVWCVEGIVSVCVLYLQGVVLPNNLFFASMLDTEVQPTTPLFLPLWLSVCGFVCWYQFVRLCRCILSSIFMRTCLCVLGCVSKCVLAACFVCCSDRDRWSTAHTQINRPTLMKSGFFCLLSNAVPHSLLCHSLYFTALSLNQGHIWIQRKLCRIATIPWRDGQRETGGRWAGCKARDRKERREWAIKDKVDGEVENRWT